MSDTDKGWERIVDAIDEKYGITSHGRDTRPLEDNPQLSAKVSYICFSAGGSEYKFERVASPAILERKSIYRKAASASGSTRFENIYDPDNLSYKTNLYRQEGGDWLPAEPSEL